MNNYLPTNRINQLNKYFMNNKFKHKYLIIIKLQYKANSNTSIYD